MKQNCVIAVLIIVFSAMGIMILNMTDNTSLTKMNILTQLIYTLVTTLLVIFSYGVLKATQQQKHQAIRPYLIAESFDMCKNIPQNRRDVEFEIYNEGSGIALNINIKVKTKHDGRLVFEEDYTRLNVKDNQIYKVLCQIRNEINLTKNQGGNGIYYLPIDEYIEVEFSMDDITPDEVAFLIELVYCDIYGKKYKSTLDLKFNQENDDTYECTEQFTEL